MKFIASFLRAWFCNAIVVLAGVAFVSLKSSVTWAQATPVKSNKAKASSVVTTPVATPLKAETQPQVSAANKNNGVLINKSISLYSYYTPAKTQFFQVNMDLGSTESSTKTRGSATSISVNEKGTLVHLLYQRGLESDMNFSVDSAFGSKKADVTGSNRDLDSSGMSDFMFKLHKIADTEIGQSFYGGFVSLSLNSKEDPYDYDIAGTKSSRTGNLYSGGHRFGGFFGTQKQTPKYVLGSKFTLEIPLNRESNGKSGAGVNYGTDTTGGMTLGAEAFAEMPNLKGVFGAKAGIEIVTDTSNTIKYENGASDSLSTSQLTLMGFGLYGKYPLSERVELLPEMKHQRMVGGGSGSLEVGDFQETNLILTARVAL